MQAQQRSLLHCALLEINRGGGGCYGEVWVVVELVEARISARTVMHDLGKWPTFLKKFPF